MDTKIVAEKDEKPVEYVARKGEGTMDEEEFNAVVSNAITQSVSFVDTELSPERARATEYYLGKPFGNEEEGRSQAILTEVRDAVDGMIPSLARIFFGSEHTVEFVPNKSECVEQAAQQTDYVRFVHEEDNQGFLNTLGVIKDGLIRKIGIFKWGWDESQDTKAYRQENITRDELEAIAEDDDVELTKVVKVKVTKQQKAEYEKALAEWKAQTAQLATQALQREQAAPDPQAPQGPGAPDAPPPGAAPGANAPLPPMPPMPQEPLFYDVEFTRTIKEGRARVWMVPPEEFFYNREARSLEEALLVGHRTTKTRGQLIAMGVDEADIDEYAGTDGSTDESLKGNFEDLARKDTAGVGRSQGFGYSNDPEMGKANDKILYCEAYMNIDADGDGLAELRKIIAIGPTFHVVKHEPVNDRPFSIFVPYPEPHAITGGSVSDRTMDVQKIDSALLRGMLDSLSGSIFPRTVYKEGDGNIADIMNTAIGAPIRERTTGSVRTLEMPFTGREALPILQFMQEVIERRTGQSKGAAGLDDDALQSTGKEAVGAHLMASQAQVELIARVFAEMAYKPLFRGLGRLLNERQPRARVVKLRGSWVEVNPKAWDNNMDVTCNVGLGTTFIDRKVQTMMAVAADQEKIITTMGLDNPLVSLPMLRNTRVKLLAMQGIKDVDNYYKPIPQDWKPPAPPAPPKSPEELAMEAEKHMNELKTQKELVIKKDELTMKQQQQTWEQNFEIQKLATETALKRYAIDAQFHSDMTEAQLIQNIQQETREVELAMQAHDQLHDQTLERAQHDHQVNMDTRAADTADAAQQADAAAPAAGEGE